MEMIENKVSYMKVIFKYKKSKNIFRPKLDFCYVKYYKIVFKKTF